MFRDLLNWFGFSDEQNNYTPAPGKKLKKIKNRSKKRSYQLQLKPKSQTTQRHKSYKSYKSYKTATPQKSNKTNSHKKTATPQNSYKANSQDRHRRSDAFSNKKTATSHHMHKSHRLSNTPSPFVKKIYDINQVNSGKQCIQLLRKFVENIPREVYFGAKGLEDCKFEITKVLMRMNSNQNARKYDYQFVFQPLDSNETKYQTGKWWLLGGQKAKTADEMKTFWPNEVIQYLCSSLVRANGDARLEVEISIKNTHNTGKCHPLMWKDGIDDEMQSLTRESNKNNRTGIRFDTSYPAQLFEFQLPNTLRYTFDFKRNKQISIWNHDELTFQEQGYAK
jgi:hypothetical protein